MIIKLADAIKWIKAPENRQKEFWIKFLKVDNSIRTMRCQTGVDDGTLIKNPMKIGMKEPQGVIKVYDMDKKEYRSFRETSLLSVKFTDEWMDIEEARIVPTVKGK